MKPLVARRFGIVGLGLACVTFALIGWVSYRRVVELREASRWVGHTLEVRYELESFLLRLQDAETGQRGFLITGAAAYLEPYEAALAALPARREKLGRLTADNPAQQASLASLDALVGEKLGELRATIALRKSRGPDAAARLVLTHEGKRVMDRIRSAIASMEAEESRLLAERSAREERRARRALVATAGGTAFGLALVLAAAALLRSAASGRDREAAARAAAEALAAAVAESAERFRVTLASVGDAVITTDRTGRVTMLNAVAERLTGWTAGDAAGRPIGEILVILDEQSRRPAESPVDRVLREGNVTGLANHTLLIARDGREIPIDDSAAPIKAGDGSLLGAIIVFRDVTERRKADERFRLAVEAAPTALVMVDRRGTIFMVNALMEDLFGYARRELIGQSIEMLVPRRFRDVHPGHRAGFLAEPSRRLMGEGRDLRALRKDGTEVAVEIGLNPLSTAEGSFVLAAIVDITERKRAEGRQTALYAVTRALADAATLEGAVVPILQAICTNLAWDFGALWVVDWSVGVLRCVDVWQGPSVAVPEFEAVTRRRTFSPGVGLVGRVWTSGQPAWIPDVVEDDNIDRGPVAVKEGLHEGFAFPILLQGEVHGVVEFFSREIRQSDPELLSLMSGLGSQIGQFIARRRAEDERTLLLAREQAARREAETANRAKDEFLAMLGHELRNPLGAITNAIGALDLIDSREGDAGRAREIVARQTQHLTRLVDDLLDMGRVMTGKIALERRPIDLGELVRRSIAARECVGNAQERAFSLEIGPVGIEADPVRVEQVVGNLLSNAVQHTGPGDEIHVAVTREADSAVIRVRDTGSGITPDLLPRVFDLFVQGPQIADRASGGLGIGLTLVRRLVELHGGTVTASSEGPGRGSTFTVCLPGAIASVAEAPSACRAGPRVASRRILIVEDNADFRDGLKQLLALRGHHVLEAADGPSAIEILRHESPDVALIDIGLPLLDGYEVARRFRSQASGNTVLVALTGYGLAVDRQRARDAGFDFHLAKPATAAQLDDVLSKAGERGVGPPR